MTQDEIIEMARQAGAIPVHKDPKNKALVGNENIEAFAKLVEERIAAKERKEMAEHCVEITRMAVDKAVASAIEKEREACAKRCEELEKAWVNAGLWKVTHEYKECSAAIRARAQADKGEA